MELNTYGRNKMTPRNADFIQEIGKQNMSDLCCHLTELAHYEDAPDFRFSLGNFIFDGYFASFEDHYSGGRFNLEVEIELYQKDNHFLGYVEIKLDQEGVDHLFFNKILSEFEEKEIQILKEWEE